MIQPLPTPDELAHRRNARDEPPDTERHDDTDLGNARRLVASHGHQLRYVPAWGTWLIWDHQRWARDETGEIERRAKQTAEALITEAISEPDDERRKKRFKFAYDSQSRARITSMISLARTEPTIPVVPGDLDADPWAFNVANGTIDLRTGTLHPHNPAQLITKLAPVHYDPDAYHDLWERFLHDATGKDQQLIDFLQRAVGYSLTGSTSEEVLFFVHGPAASGKSTFDDAIETTLGDYASRADFETFLARNAAPGAARADIARLVGARFVNSVEVDEGARLAEGLVKTLTGGDVITTRYLYQDYFEFRPQFKLWLVANHAPKVRHGDEAMWRRILRIPFEHPIPKAQRDPAIKAALRNPDVAGPAILAWAVDGCLAWQHDGLQIPDVVTRATDAYRADMDPLGDFLEDRCIFETSLWVSGDRLREEYEQWARVNGLRKTLSPNAFHDVLLEHGATPERRRIELEGKRTQRRVWSGIGLRDWDARDADVTGTFDLDLDQNPRSDPKCDGRDGQDITSIEVSSREEHIEDFSEQASRASRASHPDPEDDPEVF